MLASLADALTLEDVQLLRKEYQHYQAWSLGRNYLFGTTVKQDREKALTWQLIYTNQLPSSYPQKEKLLAPYKNGLSTAKIAKATQLAQSLRKQYKIMEPFTEVEMYRVYALHEEHAFWNDFQPLLPPEPIWTHFNKWIDWLAEHKLSQGIIELEQKMLELYADKQFPIVYGQVIIQGPEAVEMVSSEIKLLPGGFFVAHPVNKTISFALPGYKTVTIAINQALQIQSIPPILLKKPVLSKQTGVVGRVLPWSGIEKGNLLVQFETLEKLNSVDPWTHPVIPLTITNGGDFYATELVPGHYKLFINTAGVRTAKEFTVRNGEIRGLSLIDLRKIALKQDRLLLP